MDLPGYYFDKEKKKYFKIQASGSAPASSAYSNQDVKRRKLRDEREAATAREEQRQKGRIRHPRIQEEPLAGGILRRESGYGNIDSSKVFAGGLVRRGYIPQPAISPQDRESPPMFTVCHRSDLGVVDVVEVYNDRVAMMTANLDRCNHHTYQNFRINYSRSGEAFTDSGDSTSICENEANQRLAATWLAGHGNQGIAIIDSNQHALDEETRRRSRPSLLIGPGYTRGNDVSMFSSTPAPAASGLLFAFGSSHGVLTTSTETLDTAWLTPTPTKNPSVVDDLFALEFLTDNPSILLSGGRKGLLHLTDLRFPTFGADVDADTITHPSTITHIKSLDSHRIIVNGLNSNLCQYDLRFRKSDTATHSPPRSKRKSRHNLKPTRSILEYPAYQNSATVQIGFDIDLESGIVAAAQEADEFHSTVQLFSLHGGYKLDSPSVSARYEGENQSRYPGYNSSWSEYQTPTVKCLRFARDTEGEMKSLYVGHGFTIQRYAWGENENGQPPFEL